MRVPRFLRFGREREMRRAVPVDLRVLLVCLAAMAVLCAYRFYNYVTTGFYVSDEYGYYFAATHGTIYGGRWFFGDLNILLFKIPGLGSVDGFAYLLPFYLFLWSGLTFYLFYRILHLLDLGERTIALSLVSSFTLISFVLLSLGFLTEPVGLALAMGGVYAVLRFRRSGTLPGRLGFPFLAAMLFGFAGATREPYDAFLIGGVALVGVAAAGSLRSTQRLSVAGKGVGPRKLAVLSVLCFLLPAVVLYNANSAATSQVPNITQQIVQAAVSNPTIVVSPPTTTVTTTQTVVVPVTGVVTSNGTTITTTSSTTTTTTTTSVKTTSLPPYPFYARSLILNTLVIFMGGIALGWGPLAFGLGLLGFVLVFRRAVKVRATQDLLLLLAALIALGSYLVVSFIFAPDPTYFSFRNYSTILRFSDTALPAYFLMAPAFIAIIARTRLRIAAVAAIGIAFLVVAVPVYQTYASSNFNYTAGQNPFQAGYKTDAVLIRDYFDSHIPPGQSINMVGVPYGWAFTYGVGDLHVHTYSIGQIALYPELNITTFESMRWSTMYVYLAKSVVFPASQSFLNPLVNSTAAANPSKATPYSVVARTPVLQGDDFTMYEVQLQW